MAPQILFFDIDGTMLSSGGAGQRAMELALLEEFRIQIPFEGILTAGRTDCGITDELFTRYSLPDSPQQRDRFRDSYLERLPSCLAQHSGSLLPGVRELLDHLHTRPDVHLSLLTGNYVEGAWIKLRHFGIDHFFDSGGYGDDHSHRDDVARQALQNVQSQLALRTSDQNACVELSTCVIGDTPADIQCARAISAKAVAVATGVYSSHQLKAHQPDHLFDDLRETMAVAAALLTRG
jgi:phosphoglycolate phosphatase